MGRWVIKWNRNDQTGPMREHDWAAALSGSKPIECYGKADGLPALGSLSAGNIALAYQVEDHAFVGVVRVLSVESKAIMPFARVERLLRFARPVRWTDVIAKTPALHGIDAFGTGALHSMRRLSPDEFHWILDGCGVDAATRTRFRL